MIYWKHGLAALAIGALCPALAMAGPCTEDIASLGRQLSGSSALGPVTSGTLSGSNPSDAAHTAPVDTKGTTASTDQRIGGTAGTKELDAAWRATWRHRLPTCASSRQVSRLQRRRAVAAAGWPGCDNDRVSRAKVEWQKAVDLNAKNDPACKGAIQQGQADLKAG